jgi:hypothetical protein
MLARLALISCLPLCLIGTPAAAAEIWNCTTHDELVHGATEITPGHVQIKIDGNRLVWAALPEDHFRLLVNNDVGAVAVFAQATTTPAGVKVVGMPPEQASALQARLNGLAPNPLVNSFTVVLDKTHGVLRTGSVGTTEVSDVSHGECKRAPD